MVQRRIILVALLAWTASGCTYLPHCVRQPCVQNPFPQLSKVAVAPFFNVSAEPAVNGRQFALAYYNELQLTPGYEVVPIGVVEQAMQTYGLTLEDPAEAQKLAQLLEVDAVVIGAVTDFSPYYPPRCAMQVEWYAANPAFRPILPGYGLTLDCPQQQQQLPPAVMYQAKFAEAREAMQAQAPPYEAPLLDPVPQPPQPPPAEEGLQLTSHKSGATGAIVKTGAIGEASLVPLPPGAAAGAPPRVVKPVVRHVAAFNGADPKFTTALGAYYTFRHDERFGGPRGYLQRSDDFIRFCCHLHIYQTLSARGGAAESQVVWRWFDSR